MWEIVLRVLERPREAREERAADAAGTEAAADAADTEGAADAAGTEGAARQLKLAMAVRVEGVE